MGRREQKKAQMRERIAEVASGLFAARGYDEVLVLDVARAADVSEQTVYNYFPAKQDLVLDRAEEIRLRYGVVVRDRTPGTSPAEAIQPLVLDDIDRLEQGDAASARGTFSAQCVLSPALRRFALEFREQQAETIANAIQTTNPDAPALLARTHAAALVFVVQAVSDAVGAHIIAASSGTGPSAATTAAALRIDANLALDALDHTFHTITTPTPAGAIA
jgi:AcrR family transcriptional regulator